MILSVTNLKGGVGKSTIAQNLAVCLTHSGKSVFLVDTDYELRTSSDWGGDRGEKLQRIEFEAVHQDNVTELVLKQSDNYDVVIIDSLSHEWNGKGGILELHKWVFRH